VGDDLHIRANGGGLTCTVAAGKVDDVKVEINGALSVNGCGLQACRYRVCGCTCPTFLYGDRHWQARRYRIDGTGTVAGAITATETVHTALRGTVQLAVAGGARIASQQRK
jgi:hypothetical protein